MKRTWILCTVVLVLTMSCKKNDNPVSSNPSPGANQIFPMAVGNQWVMKFNVYDTLGNVQFTAIDTIRIVKDSIVGNEHWYQTSGSSSFMTHRSDGLYMTTSQPPTMQLLYKYPANVGDTWTATQGTTTMNVSVGSTGANVTVQAGTFSCYSYQTRPSSVTYMAEEDFMKAGVGPVAMDIYSKTSSGRVYKSIRLELVSYSVS